jgi:cyclopropane-fatty-acyl-phospholipid synthase
MTATSKVLHVSPVFIDHLQQKFQEGWPLTWAETFLTKKLAEAGIKVGGHHAYDIQVKNKNFFWKVIREGNLGLGESYMEGWWETKKLDEFFFRLLKSEIDEKQPWQSLKKLRIFPNYFLNMHSPQMSKSAAELHYNFSNDLFSAFLDPYLQYSCGYFDGNDTLAKAQERKLALICKKLNLQPDDHLLDVGCGWGGLMKFATQRTGCKCSGVNISAKQIEFAREFCKDLPIEILEQDYRDLTGVYSKGVSVGMFEHVGRKNHRTFFETIHRSLDNDGVFVLQTIGANDSQNATDRWITQYIFPNGYLPSLNEITSAVEGLFVVEDIHNIGPNYDKTLMGWNSALNKHWAEFTDKFDKKTHRMWNYYLQSCAGAFRARSLQCWQIVLTKNHRQQPGQLR